MINKLLLSSDNENDFGSVNHVVARIKELIAVNKLLPGEKLPSERALSQELAFSRGQIRQGIKKLEFFGIIKTMPQSGSVITGIGVPAINNMMKDILELDLPDFQSLVETRIIIEQNAIVLAAQRRSDFQMKEIIQSQNAFKLSVQNGEKAIIEDLKFHLKLAEASGNKVLSGLMKIIVPDIIAHFNKEEVCDRSKMQRIVLEHDQIVDALKHKDTKAAYDALDNHFEGLKTYIVNKTPNGEKLHFNQIINSTSLFNETFI